VRSFCAAFVVSQRRPYNSQDFRKLALPQAYVNVALKPFLAGSSCAAGEEFQLYEGATVENPVEGMFSFFPCQNGGGGFARPIIELPPYVNPKHKQGIKSAVVTLAQMKQLWLRVASQVTGQGLELGVQAEMPTEITANVPNS
jgi:hypothetical protein